MRLNVCVDGHVSALPAYVCQNNSLKNLVMRVQLNATKRLISQRGEEINPSIPSHIFVHL